MGTVRVDFGNCKQGGSQRFEALTGIADTGASYTAVPATILDALGVEREQSVNFTLADGSKRDMDIGWVQIELEGRTGHV